MPLSRGKNIWSKAPRKRLGYRNLIWLFSAPVILALTVSMSWGLGGLNVLASSQVFWGELRPTHPPVTVTLPTNAPIKKLHVAPGQNVLAGDVLVELDLERLIVLQEANSVDIQVLKFLQDCLINGPASANQTQATMLNSAQIGGTSKLHAASLRCAAIISRQQSALAKADAKIQEATEHLANVQSNIASMKTENAAKSANGQTMQVALELALAESKAKEQIIAMNAAKRDLQSSWLEAHAKRLTDIDLEITKMTETRERLDRLVQHPELIAQRDGTIMRIRSIAGETKVSDPFDFIDISDLSAQVFSAHISVEESEIHNFLLGKSVRVELLGASLSLPDLFGAVSAIVENPAHDAIIPKYSVQITLNNESRKALADPSNGLGLKGPKTTSRIRVRIGNKSLRSSVLEALHRSALTI